MKTARIFTDQWVDQPADRVGVMFAITREYLFRKLWVVTHLRTGYGASVPLRLAEARRLFAALEKQRPRLGKSRQWKKRNRAALLKASKRAKAPTMLRYIKDKRVESPTTRRTSIRYTCRINGDDAHPYAVPEVGGTK